jgi:riboflavin kinase/FMN adenylyltransferase
MDFTGGSVASGPSGRRFRGAPGYNASSMNQPQKTMRVWRGLPSAASRMPCAITIGNFDGVHRGHQALLAATRKAADQRDIESAVMTFEPHPREYFAGLRHDWHSAPTRIAGLRDKLDALSANGVDRVIVERFNASLAALSPADFVEHVLVAGCHARWVMVGEDFRFGAKRAGDVDTLRRLAANHGVEVEAMATIFSDGERVSSSLVRAALARGDLQVAARLLGRPYRISGHVVPGQRLGRTLGFPTANLRIAHQRPALSGIFVVRVHGIGSEPVGGVASLGTRPTVDDSGRVLLETHLFDFAQNLYGKLVSVEFIKKLRDEAQYPDLPALTAAIAEDARQARVELHLPPVGESFAISATDRIS